MFLIAAAIYGFVLPKNKVTVVALSTYAALAVASIWSDSVFRFLTSRGNSLGSWTANLSMFTVSAGLFILFIVVIAVRGGVTADEQKSGSFGPIINAVLGFLTAGLIITSIMSFMPDGLRENLITTSKMANLIFKYHTGWIVLPTLVIVCTSFFRRVS